METNEDEEIDIDLNDPDVEHAAVKIQAGFKGMKARKEVTSLREDKAEKKTSTDRLEIEKQVEKSNVDNSSISPTNDEIDIDLNDPEVESAANKIQAGFKGMKARKEVASLKEQKKTERENKDIINETETAPDISGETKADNELGENKEDIDIDLNDPDVEVAATKIQAGFKGMKTRKEMNAKKEEQNKELNSERTSKKDEQVESKNVQQDIDIDLEDPNIDQAATKIQAGFKGMKARKEVSAMKQEKVANDSEKASENIDIDLDDPNVEHAATKIQAGYKGMKARKEVNARKEANKVPASEANETLNDGEDIIDIDLNDPDVEMAATKIQAGFKGMKTRKELTATNKEKISSEVNALEKSSTENKNIEDTESKVEDIDQDVQEAEEAATKIQAGFKGMKVRKEIKAMKDENTENTKVEEEEEVIDIDLNDPDVEKAATKIQAGFKGMKARKEVTSMKEEKSEAQTKTDVLQEEEDIDIDLDDPDVEKAATKIQAGFKGMKARKEVTSMKVDMKNNDNQDSQNETDSRGKQDEEEIDIDLNDPEVEKAATKIQAGFKGMKSRKEVSALKSEALKNEDNLEKIENIEESNQGKPEEEVDIDLDDPEVEKAATKIQAGFKGLKARKEVTAMKKENEKNVTNLSDIKNEDIIETKKETKENQDFEDTPSENITDSSSKQDKEEIDIDLNDPDVEKAATKIQAGFKGMKTRKEISSRKEEKSENEDLTEKKTTEDVVDIDLNDPDVEQAATKIQAGFKGMKARKEVNALKESQIEENNGQVMEKEDEIDIDLDDPEVEAAATKIQAGFKGLKARKEVEEKKKLLKQEKTDVGESETAEKEIETEKSERKGENEVGNSDKEDVVDIDLEDPEVEAAATKIQAGFKGLKARKEVEEKRKLLKQEQTIVGESETTEGVVEGSADTLGESKATFNRNSVDYRDDGYNSASWTRENTFDSADSELMKNENVDHQSLVVDNKVDPKDGHVSQLVLGVAGSTASAPIFTNFGNSTDTEPSSSLTFHTSADIEDGLEDMILTEYNEDRIQSAATKLQAGYRGMKIRNEMLEKAKFQDSAVIVRESSGKVPRVGAIPFELHDTVINAKEEPDYISSNLKTNTKIDYQDEETIDFRLDKMNEHSSTTDLETTNSISSNLEIFIVPNKSDSQKLLFYLKERKIPYTLMELKDTDLTANWYLQINPNGTAPVLQFNNEIIISDDVMKMFNFLEEQYPVDLFPMLVPCTTSTKDYQKYLYYSALLENIKLDLLDMMSMEKKSYVKNLEKDLVYFKGNFVKFVKFQFFIKVF